jgi:iron complex transport system permease protein
VGLVAPHLVRPLVRHDPARALVPAGLAGAALLLAADGAVRLIPSDVEVKIGVLTALLGVPFFLWIIARRRAELAETPA